MLSILFILSMIAGGACRPGEPALRLVPAVELQAVSTEVLPATSPAVPSFLLRPVPSRDGRWIAVVRRQSSGLESAVIAIFVGRTGRKGRIKVAEATNLAGLAWSPDGTKLAYSEGNLVVVVDRDGNSRKTLYTGPGGPYPGACSGLRWSKDGCSLSCTQVENRDSPDLSHPAEIRLTLGVAARPDR